MIRKNQIHKSRVNILVRVRIQNQMRVSQERSSALCWLNPSETTTGVNSICGSQFLRLFKHLFLKYTTFNNPASTYRFLNRMWLQIKPYLYFRVGDFGIDNLTVTYPEQYYNKIENSFIYFLFVNILYYFLYVLI